MIDRRLEWISQRKTLCLERNAVEMLIPEKQPFFLGSISSPGGRGEKGELFKWGFLSSNPSITPTEERSTTTSPARSPRPGYYYEIDKTAYRLCVASEMVDGTMGIASGALIVSGNPVVVLVAATWMAIEGSNIASRCRQEATREYKWGSIEDFK